MKLATIFRQGMRVALVLCVGLTLAGVAVAQADRQADPQADPQEEPLDLGLREEVDLRFVLIDFLVLDGADRTVPDLQKDDFRLFVSGKKVPIDTLDQDCPIGQSADPQSLPAERPGEPVEPAMPRKIVLVFDYAHMTDVAATLDSAFEALETWSGGADEHMVVSMGEVVRIETPFTKDLEEVRWTLRRMRNDPDLYAGNFGSLTETRFFERVEVLFDLMERLPGRKSIVLFSGPLQPDGFDHDPSFRTIAAMSGTSRTAIYPVDTGGLRAPGDPAGSLGGPPRLRRLANETGGRMTANSNTIGLAYARAHRDLGCTYTLGFEDRRLKFDKKRNVQIKIRGRKNLRVVYPGSYIIRSHEKKRKSMQRTAAMTPHMFESDTVDAAVFVLGPLSRDRWRAVLGVEVQTDLRAPPFRDEIWELEVYLRKQNGTVVHSFEQPVEVPASIQGDDSPRSFAVFQEIDAPPGRYIVSAVLSDPDEQIPRAVTRAAVLAEIPREAPFLIGPILGHEGEDVAGGTGFEPLLVPRADPGDALDSLTRVCVVGEDESVERRTVTRRISSIDGQEVQSFESVVLELPGGSKARCRQLVDRVSTGTLAPGRYEFSATIGPGHVEGGNTVEFTIGPVGNE